MSSADYLLPGQFVGCYAGSLSSLHSFIGPSFGSNNAYIAEVAALFWGSVLALRLPGPFSTVFRADNVSALQGVAGHMNLQDHPLCRAAVALHTAFRLLRCQPTYQYVPGHACDTANELADALAGDASRRDLTLASLILNPDPWFNADGSAFAWLPHVCMSMQRPGVLPSLRGELMSWSREFTAGESSAALRPFLRATDGCQPTKTQARPVSYEVTCASFNTLSLLEVVPGSHAAGLHGATGRVKLLCASLRQFNVSIAGLQECRTPKGTSFCQGFRRFASGRDSNACFGVELWIDTESPLGQEPVTVLHVEPTVLIASIPFQGLPLRILVAHGPHRVHPFAVKSAWWTKVSGLCKSFSRGCPWIILLDGNCRVGSVTDASVGGHQADEEDDSGLFFRGLLGDLCCWLPATFASTAFGPGGTLYQKRNGDMDRSDFVAVPSDWTFTHCTAWVEAQVSAGHSCLDHFAAMARFGLRFQSCTARRSAARRIDVNAVLDPNNAPQIDAILSSVPVLEWSVDASDHAAAVVEHIYRGLADAFPRQRRRMRGQHFSDNTQALHQRVGELRHALRTRSQVLLCAILRCAFLAWCQHRPFVDVYTGRWLWQVQIRRAADCMLLRRFGLALRRSCKVDRHERLAELSLQIATSPCGDLSRAVRQVMRPKKFRRNGNQPLPLLKRTDGSPCLDQHEVCQVWRDHFRVLEAGLECSPVDLARRCRERQLAFEGTDTVAAREVPAWGHLQAAFKHTSPYKACGPDLLPPAICSVFAQRMTEVFWPVMLKAVLRSNEPVGLKGGVMHKIPKPSAVEGTTAGFRGILVQSCLSKALHRATRHLAVSHWDQAVLPLQIGGRKGCPATFGHFCTRAFLSYARGANKSAAVVFVDIAAAYYGVIREAILGANAHTRPLQALVESLGLSDADLQMLQHYVDSQPVLREQDASPLFCEIASELHHNTWFVMSGDSCLVETFRGTRPGGSLADVIFNILFSKVLSRRDRTATGRFVPQIPWDGIISPWPTSQEAQHDALPVEAGDVVYADDLASFLVCTSAAHLPRAIAGAVAETVDVMLPHGLNANIYWPDQDRCYSGPGGTRFTCCSPSVFQHGQGSACHSARKPGSFSVGPGLSIPPPWIHYSP